MPFVIALGQAWQTDFYEAIYSASPPANGSLPWPLGPWSTKVIKIKSPSVALREIHVVLTLA